MGIGLGGASASMVAGARYSLSALQPACCLHLPCAFIDADPDAAPDPVLIAELRGMIEHVGPFHAGEYIHRMGEPILGVCEVRSGAVKTVADDRDGGEQVLGFTLPGELLGLNGAQGARHPSSAVALETVHLCRMPFSALADVARRFPRLQLRLFSLLSREIGKAALLAANCRVEERLALFLLDMSARYRRRGLSPVRFRLPMARSEIANHLRMAPATASRALRRLSDEGLIRLQQREVHLLQPEALAAMAAWSLGD
ncbi:helix-turn-helix domain-containing protein [Stenotrophomonas maltophilia]|uniref:helix-turn-helix domain-containing protein n=1 Tax=Stenotrophomonas maltophilia TaxID=40324 RepID=UPI0009B27BBC|nr:helix-turn-helix domain-containing protein [Stenotrophomonas maltophilia]